MACISKHYNRERAQRFHHTGPFNDTDVTGVGMGVRGKMIHDQDDEISDGD